MRLPMADDDARWFSATDITRLVGAGELEPRAVVRAHLAAIERLDPRIHAYVHVDRNARAAGGPMSGVTLAVKDNLPVAGMPWTDGSAGWGDRVADADTVPAARGRAAGARILR